MSETPLLVICAAVALMGLCAAAETGSGNLGRYLPRSFRGSLTDPTAEEPSAPEPLAQTPPSADMNLPAMARWALEYLRNNPEPARDHECRFLISPLSLRPLPGPDQFDFISLGDTECRMDWEWFYMRRMSGEREVGKEVEQAVRRRILGYVREGGLSWLPPYCLNCNDSDHAPAALNWTTGNTIVTLLELHQETGEQSYLRQAGKMVRALRSLASWDRGRAWYPGGLGAWRNGWVMTGCAAQYPSILEPIVRYYEATKNDEALDFAIAWAEGQLAGLQEGAGNNHFRPDGSFTHVWNTHLHMRPVLGVAHLGALVHEPRYLNWARNAYESLRALGLDWGWFPECVGRDYSETCNTADMTDVAMWLAKAGFAEYWDHLERHARNYLREAQFFVTPEFERLYRELHRDKPAEEVEKGLVMARRLEGGFHAVLTPNDWVHHDGPTGMNMMGCCPPEGMRALYTAWDNVVTEDSRTVWINLSFSRDTPQAKVVSFLPNEGRLTVVAKKDGRFLLRAPAWVPRSRIKAYRGQEQMSVWHGCVGDYIEFEDVKAGEELTVTYPLPRFEQTVDLDPAGVFTYRWLGNTVLGVHPRGERLPIFANVPRPLPALR